MTDESHQPPDVDAYEDPRIYPGLAGGVFEKAITFLDQIERIPLFLFFVLLGLFSYLLRPGVEALAMAAFYLGDWLIMLSLHRSEISFGPSKPQVLMLASLRAPFALLPAPWWWLLQIVGTALVLYAFRLEPMNIRLRHEKLDLNEDSEATTLRIMHFGDLHIERTTDRDRQVIRWIEEYEPDLILYSGDVFSYSNVHDPVAHQHASELMAQMDAPLGVYAVLGSPPVDVSEVLIKFYERLPIKLLMNEAVSLRYEGKAIKLIGLTCSHNPEKDSHQLERLSSNHSADLDILLYHSPDLAPQSAQRGIDIQFSGHTHGGQVRLPFFGAIFTSSLYGKKFESGRYEIDELTLFVTRGIGLEGRGAPRVRFLCPPECSLWDVRL